uniref:Copia protein n=1 Tax=Tanacetum cinerariifolium TaxID=118510 RepID=A0A6L2JDI7_TANCI|nr:copia protein [Tanacetum cinerariifolium]
MKPVSEDIGRTRKWRIIYIVNGLRCQEMAKILPIKLKGYMNIHIKKMLGPKERTRAEQCLVGGLHLSFMTWVFLQRWLIQLLKGLYPIKSLSRFAHEIALCTGGARVSATHVGSGSCIRSRITRKMQQSWVIQAGSAGIIVSIHRARQLDYVPATIMVLEEGRTKGSISYLRTSLANKKHEYTKSEEKKEDKKVDEKKRDMSKVKWYNCKKGKHFTKDCKNANVKDYNYCKTKMLLAKKNGDEQVLLAEDQAWMESDTRSAYACNDAMNVSCDSRLYASCDANDLFVFDDIVQVCLWIIDAGCSKHMTGNRALLTNFVQKFLRTVRFGNNNLSVITGCGDVVIGSMTIKKIYYVKGLGHNLFSVGQFCDKALEVAFRKSTCFIRNEDGVDLLTGDRSLNLYTIALNEVVSNYSACPLAKASSSQSWLWINGEAITTACFTQNRSIIHKRFDKTPYELTNKRKPNIKFFYVFGCRCYLLNDYDDVGKLKAKGDIGVFVGYLKESAAFRVYNKRTQKIHESVNVNFDEISEMASKQFSLEPGLSNLNEMGKSSNL